MSQTAPPTAPGRRWVELLFLGVGLSLLAYVVSRHPLRELYEVCSNLGAALIFAPVFALGWHACNARSFGVLLDHRVPWSVLYWNRLVGDGYNNLLPLAGLGGEPFKLRHLSRVLPTDEVVVALIRDRIIDSAFGFLCTGVCLAWSLGRIALPPLLEKALWAFLACAFSIAILAAALLRSRLPGHVGGLVARWLGGGTPAALVGLPLGKLGRAVVWHLPSRILGLVEVAFIFHLLKLPIDPVAIVLTDSLLNVAGFIGFAIPQGLGVFEGTSVYLFGLLGYAGPVAIAFALVRRGRLLAVSLLGVMLHLPTFWRGRADRPPHPPR